MTETVVHTIPPVYDSRSRILILGTMPSPKSREIGFYYGNPRNRFWTVLSRLLDQPCPDSTAAKRQFLLEHRIALWDVLQSCSIDGASDGSIRDPVPNDFSAIFSEADIQAVFTTGTKAYQLYQKLCFPNTGMAARPLPSTSPANCRLSTEQLVDAYRPILSSLASRPGLIAGEER